MTAPQQFLTRRVQDFGNKLETENLLKRKGHALLTLLLVR